ncbi:MAG: Rieske 2Fe-2S domain-containing protein [Deltaproteobacteria bacterium]|nr:Rieske 2Fe-2S domain-containing protein [Deltaproteobacteria bacterium]
MPQPTLKRSLFQRIFGICATLPPRDAGCWQVEGSRVTVTLAQAPELAQPYGAVRLEGKALARRVLVYQGGDGRFHALHNRCSHMGRRLDPVPGDVGLQCCSLGRSRYDDEGHVQGGLAHGAVAVFPVTEEEGRLVIETG